MGDLSKEAIETEKKRTRDLSIKEGAVSSIMSGAGESYIVPFALALNANNAQVGFLTSFVSLFGALSQIIGSKLSYIIDRKKILLVSVFLQATMWLSLVILGFLFWKNIFSSYAATTLIVLYCVYAIFGNLGGPSWFSMMGDVVSSSERGKYFSKRNKITGLVSIIITFSAALFLDYTKRVSTPLLGFGLLFVIAMTARYISFFLLSKHYDPEYKAKKENYFSFIQFVRKAPFNNFGLFVIYIGCINFSVNIAGPFFSVYMLKELGYSYSWFTIVNLSAGLFTLFSMSFWGKFGDRFGNKKMLAIGSVIISILPFFWLFFKNPLYLILTAQLAGGIGWAAFNLAASNFIYDTVTPDRRSICVAYFSMICGIGVFFGAITGGLIAQYVHLSFINNYFLVFLISGLLRSVFSIIFVPLIKEVRQIIPEEEISFVSFLTNNFPRPFYGIFREVSILVANVFGREKNHKSLTFPKS